MSRSPSPIAPLKTADRSLFRAFPLTDEICNQHPRLKNATYLCKHCNTQYHTETPHHRASAPRLHPTPSLQKNAPKPSKVRCGGVKFFRGLEFFTDGAALGGDRRALKKWRREKPAPCTEGPVATGLMGIHGERLGDDPGGCVSRPCWFSPGESRGWILQSRRWRPWGSPMPLPAIGPHRNGCGWPGSPGRL